MPDIRVNINEGAIENLKNDLKLRDNILEAVQPNINKAKINAPHKTGSGALSIHADSILDNGWTLRISWDQEHFYMRFHEIGTKYLPARPFLVPAFE